MSNIYLHFYQQLLNFPLPIFVTWKDNYVNEYNSIHQLNYKTSRGNTFQYINLGASHYQYYQLRVLLK